MLYVWIYCHMSHPYQSDRGVGKLEKSGGFGLGAAPTHARPASVDSLHVTNNRSKGKALNESLESLSSSPRNRPRSPSSKCTEVSLLSWRIIYITRCAYGWLWWVILLLCNILLHRHAETWGVTNFCLVGISMRSILMNAAQICTTWFCLTGMVSTGNFAAPLDKNEQYDVFKREDGKVRTLLTLFHLQIITRNICNSICTEIN